MVFLSRKGHDDLQVTAIAQRGGQERWNSRIPTPLGTIFDYTTYHQNLLAANGTLVGLALDYTTQVDSTSDPHFGYLLVTLDPENGRIQWRSDNPYQELEHSEFALTNGGVIGWLYKQVQAQDATTGEIRWKYDTQGKAPRAITVAGSLIYLFFGKDYSRGDPGRTVVLNSDTGAKLSETPNPSELCEEYYCDDSLLTAGSVLFLSFRDGAVTLTEG